MNEQSRAMPDEPWSEVVEVEYDGVVVPVRISNVPPRGTPRRVYWFSAPPVNAEDADDIAAHIAEVGGILNQITAD